MKKRLLSLLLVVVMVVSMLSVSAFADDDPFVKYYGTYDVMQRTWEDYDTPITIKVGTFEFSADSCTYTPLEGEPITANKYGIEVIEEPGVSFAIANYKRDGSEQPDFGVILENNQLILGCNLFPGEFFLVQAHDWHFGSEYLSEAGYDVLTAECCEDGHTCQYQSPDGMLRLHLVCKAGEVSLGSEDDVARWQAAGLALPEITYSSSEGGMEPTTDAPTEEGRYIATATIRTGDEPWESKFISIPFEVIDKTKKYYAVGKGTEDEPYQISTLEQLIDLAAAVDGIEDYGYDEPDDMSEKYFVLVENIGEVDEDGNVISGMPVSIGYEDYGNARPFNGTFKGAVVDEWRGEMWDCQRTVVLDMKEIRFLPEETGKQLNFGTRQGLFYQIGTEGSVSGLVVKGKIGENGYYGGVCWENCGTIQNCVNEVSPTGGSYIGGICGRNKGSVSSCVNKAPLPEENTVDHFGGVCYENLGTISDCTNEGSMYANASYIGGICAENWDDGEIISCTNRATAEIYGGSDSLYVGGICGSNKGCIEECVNEAKIESNGDDFGGVCGWNYGTIKESTNNGAIIGYAGAMNFGGVCGYAICWDTEASSKDTIIEECKNTGKITGYGEGESEFAQYFGGICGGIMYMDLDSLVGVYIKGCVNTEEITTAGDYASAVNGFGGICGDNHGNCMIVNCINRGDVGANGGRYFGGLCGENRGYLLNSASFGDVGSAEVYTGIYGGLCGYNGNESKLRCGIIRNCTGNGQVLQSDSSVAAVVGGVCGITSSYLGEIPCEITNCYYDVAVASKVEKAIADSTNTTDTDVEGLTTAQMKADHDVAIAGENVPHDGKALVDLLNEYIDSNNDTDSWWHWTKDADGYPYPAKKTYNITVKTAEHGKVTVPSSYVVASTDGYPVKVSVTATPDETYKLKSLVYNDGEDHDITSEKSFNMPAKNVTLTAVFGLAKSTPTADNFTVTLPQNPIYDGESKAATPQVKEGVTDMGTITVKYSSDNGSNWSASAPVDAGTYQVALDVAEGASYQAASGLTNDSWTFTIEKATPTADDFTFIAPSNLTYDGKAKAAAVTFNSQNDKLTGMGAITVMYQYGVGSEEWKADAPSAAMDYDVAITVAEGTNYKAATNRMAGNNWKFTIAKGNQTAPGQGEGYTLNYANETLVAKDGYEVSSTNTEVTELPENKVTPGNSYYVRKKGNSNYEDSAWLTIQVPARPALNTTASATNDRITVKPVEGAKYKLDAGDWQDSNVFEDLTAGTTYTVSVKIPATDSSFAAKQTISVTTLNAQIVTQGSIEVEVQGETRPENAKVEETITDTDEKEAASAIAGAINSASSGENKSNIVDLTEVVSKKIKDMTMESVQALAEKNEKSTDLTKLLNAADAAKDAGKTVDVSMKMTTDINVAVTNVKVNETEKTRIETFTLDISPVYTLVVESIIKEDGKEPVSDTVTVADGKPLEVTETTIVTFPAPDGFELAGDDVLYIVHTKADGAKYTYVANYDSATKMISFTNPHGFSEFEMVKASGMVAQNVTTGVFYSTLTDALAEAKKDATVVLLTDLTDEKAIDFVEIAPDVTLDLNGFNLKARLVIAFGLVKDSTGGGKLITAKDHFAYFGGKEITCVDHGKDSTETTGNILPVWNGSDGYVFCSVSRIGQEWQYGLGDTEHNPKYRFQPHADEISKILDANSDVKVYVEFNYTKTTTNDQGQQQMHDYHLIVEFGRTFITKFLDDPTNKVMYVSLLGTEGVSSISARSILKAENCNFSIASEWITTNSN